MALFSRPFCSCNGRPGEPGVFIRRAQVHDPHLPWIPYVSTTTRRIPSGAVRRCGDVSTAVASGLRLLQ
jgi:hypothetical protein